MAVHIKEVSKKVIFMVREYINGKMAENILVITKETLCKVLDVSSILTGESIKGSF